MTNGPKSGFQRHFALTWLPWIVGVAALGLYLVTLNRSLSFLPEWSAFVGLPIPAPGVRLTGWNWYPEFITPAYYLVTFPIRWLPDRLIPVAVNLFSALCAALTLVHLARSVALLPQDRTRDQRERFEGRDTLLFKLPLGWLPTVLAVVVCGLGLSFWEHSTNGTVEMFDLLLFAYVVRSLLEYRLDEQEPRLYRAAFVFGVGMTGNAAMVALLPVFIAALVWTRKLAFFNLRFLGRMALCGLAGLSLFLLLPAIGMFAPDQTASFWELLKMNLASQKMLLTMFPKKIFLLLALTSLLPVFLLSIRWSSDLGDSRIGMLVTTYAFRVCHVVILLACLWVALDPSFSPRNAGYGFAFLPLYFLSALSVGYFSGYVLLISRAVGTRLRAPGPGEVAIQHAVRAVLIAVLIVMPTVMLFRNLPQIRLTNGPVEDQLAADLAGSLPPKGVILSDDPRRLWVVQYWLARNGRTRDYTVLCTQWLKSPAYHGYLRGLHSDWPIAPKDENPRLVEDVELVQLMQNLAKDSQLVYLHPSFGYYFEYFGFEPHGLTLWLRPHANTYLVPPPSSAETIARNEKFWSDAKAGALKTILPFTVPPDPARRLTTKERIFALLRLKPEQNRRALVLGALYSRSLVHWGAELQKAGQFEPAAEHFNLALQLNRENVVAEANLAFNQKYRAGENVPVQIDESVEDRFGKHRSWEEVLAQNGPYDEPSLTYAQGYVFARGNLIRQAAQAFDRVRALSPDDLGSRLWLAQLHMMTRFPDQALSLASEVRDRAGRTPGALTNLVDLFTLEASAYFIKNEPDTAVRLIESNLESQPRNFQLLAAACKTYSDYGRYTNALELTERMLKLDPQNPACWLNQGCFLVEMSEYDRAISAFDRVLTLETNNYTATLYRAIAQLRADKLDGALADYETVQRQYPKLHQVYYGLGEIAYRRNDTNTAIRHYESYLSNAPPGYAESKFVAGRLRELHGEPPEPARPPEPPQ